MNKDHWLKKNRAAFSLPFPPIPIGQTHAIKEWHMSIIIFPGEENCNHDNNVKSNNIAAIEEWVEKTPADRSDQLGFNKQQVSKNFS